jgi:hypothetical protein
VRQPLGEQHLTVRRDHDPGAAGQRVPGADGERLGGTLIDAELARLAGGIGQGNVPGMLLFRHRVRHLDRGRRHEVGRIPTRLEGAQPGIQFQPAEPEQRKGVRGIWHVPITAGRRPPGQCGPRIAVRSQAGATAQRQSHQQLYEPVSRLVARDGGAVRLERRAP